MHGRVCDASMGDWPREPANIRPKPFRQQPICLEDNMLDKIYKMHQVGPEKTND